MIFIISQLIVATFGLLIGSGILLIVFRNSEPELAFMQGDFRKKMNKTLKKSLKAKRENNLLYGTTKYLDRNIYNTARLGVLAFFIVVGVLKASLGLAVFGVILYLMSYPQELTAKGMKLPYHYFIRTIKRGETKKKDHELMEALSILKNLMVQQKDNPLGADYIIEYLAQDAKLTKAAYLHFLSKLRLGQLEEATMAFSEEINTALGKDVAHLFSQLDRLNPAEMEEAVVSRQRHIRELKTTEEKNKDQLKSDLIYAPVVITVLAIFMNFIVVVFWVGQADTLSQIISF